MERRLSEPERAVLRLHGAGLPPYEIARRLGMSETTVAWIVSNLVSEWGARRTAQLAVTLAASQRGRFVAQVALPLFVMAVITVATVAALGATGTLHGPIAPTDPASASPTTLDTRPPLVEQTPMRSVAPAAGDGAPTIVPTAAPAAPTFVPTVPTRAPALPTIAPVLPTTVPSIVPTALPSLPVPLPPLPTVPPLPTPHVPGPELPLQAP